MASIRKEVRIETTPDLAWNALRDVGALHTRLCPGFVIDTRLEGRSRVVTFGNGTSVREDIASVDDAEKRVCWAIVGQQFHHYQGAALIEADGAGTRFIWMADLLPDELAPNVETMMNAGMDMIRKTLEAAR
jgi:carbon monoxide dehydrogenase subunit G